MPGRMPTGRAGRVWLVDRLHVAQRAAELLEDKQQLLRREQRRLGELADRTGREWTAAAAEAGLWSRRSHIAEGPDELRRRASRVAPARVRLEWASQAGVTYPSAVDVDLPPAPDLDDTPALARASDACRRALAAGVRHGAATLALERVDAELALTIRRLRAIRDRWTPELRERLERLDLRMDETEREEITRTRWASGTAVGGDHGL